MWEPLFTAVVGGLVVNGFAIVLGALMWVKQQNWNQKREIYSDLLPILTRFYNVNRLLVSTLRRAPDIDEEEFKKRVEERQSLFERLDEKYSYAKLFVSEHSQQAITKLIDSVHGVADPVKESEDFLELREANATLLPLAEAAIKAVFLSAKDDLRFAFEIPFTGYVIGEGTKSTVEKPADP